ncbi:MAG TPA: HAMP domain-containing sensor histidine kinase [Polyangia bacterium]|nr:HAMP domain-containing sensor histidine kinase [Polyangia bacterium]
MARKHVTPSARALVAGFACVAGSFLMATVASEWSDVRIRRDAALITGTVAPSIVHLEGFRSEARRLVGLADDEIDRALERQRERARPAPPRRGAPVKESAQASAPAGTGSSADVGPGAAAAAGDALFASILASKSRLQREWQAYRAMPALPRERELGALAADLHTGFTEDLDRALQAARAGQAATALDILERRVKPAADAVDDAVVRLVERNAQEATRLGTRIDLLGRRSIALALGLDGLSVLLTIGAALLLARFFRRYAQLVEQRAEELELFASRVAHDVLSPLGAASLALSYLADKGNIEDPRARKMLALGRRGLERTRLIADDLLEFASAGARPDPTALADVSVIITAVVEETRPLAEERRITLTTEGIDAGYVRCSQGILSSLVSNLVRNAVKYVGDGPDKQVRVRARAAGAFVRIEVEDNGPGLPPNMESAVFEPYVRGPQNHQPGIGLGLATVKRVAEAHGGRVDVRSTPGAGCCFRVELPVAFAAVETSGATRENSLPRLGNPPRVGAEDEHGRVIAAEDQNPSEHPG